MPRSACVNVGAQRLTTLTSGPRLAKGGDMSRTAVFEEPTEVRAPARSRDDEPTLPFCFESAELCPDEKLVIGYLTMEEQGMFAELPMDEQERVATTLWR
jgi:hypothetical protein